MSYAMKMVPAVLLAAAVFAPAALQAQSVAGKWDAEYPTRVRMVSGGAAEAEQMGSAVLTLEAKGDSVFGTWAPQNTPAPVPARAVKGTFKEGRLNLVSEPTEARVRRSMDGGADNETPIKMVTYFEGTVKDGAIDGMMHSESDDQAIRSTPIKWTAKASK
jgi:hypothetical protein